jgi:hypothetical protein
VSEAAGTTAEKRSRRPRSGVPARAGVASDSIGFTFVGGTDAKPPLLWN